MSNVITFNDLDLRARLERRGVSLRKGLTERLVVRLIGKLEFEVDQNFIAMYRQFDGFVEGEMDSGSAIALWPLERILEENRSIIALRKSRLSFADFMMNSNDLTCDFQSACSPVRYLDDPKDVAESFLSFCSKLVDGEYDF